MQKILLATGNRNFEDYLVANLSKELDFVGEVIYREGLVRTIGQKRPNIVLLRDALQGSTDLAVVINEVRNTYPDVRIIYVGVERNDSFYNNLVNQGVYDLIVGGTVDIAEVIDRIRVPAKYNDVKHFQTIVAPPTYPLEATPTPIEFDTEVEGEEEEVEKAGGILGKLKNLKMPTLPKRELPKLIQQKAKVSTAGGKGKIVSFIGGRSGIGTSTIAINTAFRLAQGGDRVLYMEVNQLHPSASHWFDLQRQEEGIDTALRALSEKRYKEVRKAIVKSSELKEKGGAMKSNFKKFPKTLDFMSYSGEYILNRREEDNKYVALRELYLYLLYQEKYDFVILDMSFMSHKKDFHEAYVYSNVLFTVLNQDVSSVSFYLSQEKNLGYEGITLAGKNNIVINRFEKSNFGEKDLKSWLSTSQLILVPENAKEFIENNYVGLPSAIQNKNSDFAKALEEIIEKIGGN